jgi:ketosteroid isomerase-like protein
MSQHQEGKDDLDARLQRLEDIEAIKWLIVQYARGADRNNDVDILMPLFTDDAVWDAGERFGRYEGKEAIRQFLLGSGSFIGWTLHYMVSPAVKIADDGKTAQAFWYLWETANMPNAATHEPEAMWIGGTYDTTLVKEDGEWKFKHVNLNIKLLSPYTEGWAKKQVRD